MPCVATCRHGQAAVALSVQRLQVAAWLSSNGFRPCCLLLTRSAMSLALIMNCGTSMHPLLSCLCLQLTTMTLHETAAAVMS